MEEYTPLLLKPNTERVLFSILSPIINLATTISNNPPPLSQVSVVLEKNTTYYQFFTVASYVAHLLHVMSSACSILLYHENFCNCELFPNCELH